MVKENPMDQKCQPEPTFIWSESLVAPVRAHYSSPDKNTFHKKGSQWELFLFSDIINYCISISYSQYWHSQKIELL